MEFLNENLDNAAAMDVDQAAHRSEDDAGNPGGTPPPVRPIKPLKTRIFHLNQSGFVGVLKLEVLRLEVLKLWSVDPGVM